jgi:hypothetical protein
MDHKVAIVNERGEVMGTLRVGVEPITKEDEEKLDFNKGVRQIAKLTFREDDFMKRSMKKVGNFFF